VDGVRLFESFTKLSRDITIRYKNGTIIAELPAMKDNLALAIKVIDTAREAKKSEN
jgi:transcription-repair coupling factor (superfamily II helicase)